MKKANRIFSGLVVLELIAVIVLFFVKNPCGSACAVPGLLHPFPAEPTGDCILMCVEYHSGWFYLAADLLIITLIIYILYLAISKEFQSRKIKNSQPTKIEPKIK